MLLVNKDLESNKQKQLKIAKKKIACDNYKQIERDLRRDTL
jgi:hypothetical protein